MSKKLINGNVIAHVVSYSIIMMGVLMLPAVATAAYYGESDLEALCFSFVITLGSGGLLSFLTRKSKDAEIKKRDGYLIVTLSWVSMAIFATLPYLLSGAIPSISNAFFESMSGLTTTGATILDDIESKSHGILLWRSMTQWIGGMGIIVLTIAILPLLGIGGMELFVAEAPGPTKDKIHPRIKETAKRLWAIYLLMTITETVILMFCGMSFYDAINHSLTTTSTGGFSTKQDSIAAFNSPVIEMVIVFFMFLAGTNFTLIYFGFKGKFRQFLNNDEFKYYLGAVIGLIAVITPIVYFEADLSFGRSLRDTTFQVVSMITTTGYATADYTSWGPLATFIFFLLLFSGASAGSTSGGIKIVRIVTLMKNGFLEFKKRLHPNAVIPVNLNKQTIPPHIIYNLLAFIFLYLFIFTVGAIVMTALGESFDVALSSVATSLGNVGPGIAEVGPANTFSHISDPGKWVLSFLMLFGRLELFTVALLFTPYYWRRN
ncbi:TrkH family potassium uptake protein [Paracrocinitomix mangrovi]|uniref:TrkH family potassium uptake protein n=1 Tax=Paracrocinitomix mangrovi TaxID=2862509 RepID=UPI001C8D1B8D|nr:TrkH family potassium uptake protein [Paracrocinitomix mangrovi]UKN02438.1 TrkH family potassium uptake protein [Paracrocinitomix mangrovi]